MVERIGRKPFQYHRMVDDWCRIQCGHPPVSAGAAILHLAVTQYAGLPGDDCARRSDRTHHHIEKRRRRCRSWARRRCWGWGWGWRRIWVWSWLWGRDRAQLAADVFAVSTGVSIRTGRSKTIISLGLIDESHLAERSEHKVIRGVAGPLPSHNDIPLEDGAREIIRNCIGARVVTAANHAI